MLHFSSFFFVALLLRLICAFHLICREFAGHSFCVCSGAVYEVYGVRGLRLSDKRQPGVMGLRGIPGQVGTTSAAVKLRCALCCANYNSLQFSFYTAVSP